MDWLLKLLILNIYNFNYYFFEKKKTRIMVIKTSIQNWTQHVPPFNHFLVIIANAIPLNDVVKPVGA